tara:strand:+ start:24717 stop:26483 length:1767 start_codon:yes stop_codon:yes gene_type:complete
MPSLSQKKSRRINSTSLLIGLFNHLRPRRKFQLGILLTVMTASGLAELISLGSVIPFLSALTNVEKLMNVSIINKIYQILGLETPIQLLIVLSCLFGITALLAAAVRLLNYWLNTRLAAAIGSDLSCEVYRRTLFQPYITHVNQNSSSIITASTNQISIVVDVVRALLQLFTASIISIFLLAGFFLINWKIAISFISAFSILYVLLAIIIRKKLTRNSYIIASSSIAQVKALQEGLGSFRELILNRSQRLYLDTYRTADLKYRLHTANNQFLGIFPRYALEAFGMLSIALLAAFLVSNNPESPVLPVLGAVALGSQRLLPVLQHIYGSWSAVKGSKASVATVLDILNKPLPYINPIREDFPFDNQIKLESVSFRYNDEGPLVLKSINLKINKGERIGLVGTTGSGKSTLVDLIMGLLEPTNGKLIVDNKNIYSFTEPGLIDNWRSLIAHVPQNIYLADCSIAQNIALGSSPEKIDLDRVREAAKKAQIAEYIESQAGSYKEIVGERGIRLSGGQRQRIGIARALYQNKSVLIFDEATSALDNFTESAVMNSINNLSRDLTFIIIAHRISTLNSCDRIIEIKKGEIIDA